jgi:hypothetical protein
MTTAFQERSGQVNPFTSARIRAAQELAEAARQKEAALAEAKKRADAQEQARATEYAALLREPQRRLSVPIEQQQLIVRQRAAAEEQRAGAEREFADAAARYQAAVEREASARESLFRMSELERQTEIAQVAERRSAAESAIIRGANLEQLAKDFPEFVQRGDGGFVTSDFVKGVISAQEHLQAQQMRATEIFAEHSRTFPKVITYAPETSSGLSLIGVGSPTRELTIREAATIASRENVPILTPGKEAVGTRFLVPARQAEALDVQLRTPPPQPTPQQQAEERTALSAALTQEVARQIPGARVQLLADQPRAAVFFQRPGGKEEFIYVDVRRTREAVALDPFMVPSFARQPEATERQAQAAEPSEALTRLPEGFLRQPPMESTIGKTAEFKFEKFAPPQVTAEEAARLAEGLGLSPETRQALRSFVAEERFREASGLALLERTERAIAGTSQDPLQRIPREIAAGTVSFFARASPTGPLTLGQIGAKAAGAVETEEEIKAAGRVVSSELTSLGIETALFAAMDVGGRAVLRPLGRAAGFQVPPAGKSVLVEVTTREGRPAIATFQKIKGGPEPTARGPFEISTFAESPRGVVIPVQVKGVVGRLSTRITEMRVAEIPPRGLSSRVVPPAEQMVAQPPVAEVAKAGRGVETAIRAPEEFAGPRAIGGEPTEFFQVRPGTRIPLAEVIETPAPKPKPPPVEPARIQDVRRAEVVSGFSELPSAPAAETGVRAAGGFTLPGMLVVPQRLAAREAERRTAAIGVAREIGAPTPAMSRSEAVVVRGPSVLGVPVALGTGVRQTVFEAVGIQPREATVPVGRTMLRSEAREVYLRRELPETFPRHLSAERGFPVVRVSEETSTPQAFRFGDGRAIAFKSRADIRAIPASLRQMLPPKVPRPTTDVPRQKTPPPLRLHFAIGPSQKASEPAIRISRRRTGPPARPRRVLPRAGFASINIEELRAFPDVARVRRRPPLDIGTILRFRRGRRALGPALDFPTGEEIFRERSRRRR